MLPESLDLKKLRAFQLAARHGSLRIAAAQLRLTVPAVSFQIKRLEQELGVTLFERLPNGLSLTAAGQNFVRDAESIFAKVEDALSTFSKKTLGGRISLSAGSDVAWYLTPLIASFVREFPTVDLSHHVLTATEGLARMRKGKLDLCVGYFPGEHEFETVPVFRTGLSLVCEAGHDLSKARKIGLKELASHRLVLLPKQSATRKMIDRAFTAAGLYPRKVIESGTCEMACKFAEQGAGIAIVHSRCFQHYANDALTSVDMMPAFGSIEYSALYRKVLPSAEALQVLLAKLAEAKPAG